MQQSGAYSGQQSAQLHSSICKVSSNCAKRLLQVHNPSGAHSVVSRAADWAQTPGTTSGTGLTSSLVQTRSFHQSHMLHMTASLPVHHLKQSASTYPVPPKRAVSSSITCPNASLLLELSEGVELRSRHGRQALAGSLAFPLLLHDGGVGLRALALALRDQGVDHVQQLPPVLLALRELLGCERDLPLLGVIPAGTQPSRAYTVHPQRHPHDQCTTETPVGSLQVDTQARSWESHRPETWQHRGARLGGSFRGATDAGTTPGPAHESDVLESLLGEAGLLLEVSEVHMEPHLLVQGMLQVVRAHLQDLQDSAACTSDQGGVLTARQ